MRANTAVSDAGVIDPAGLPLQVRFYPDTYHGFAIRGDPRSPGMEAVKEEVRPVMGMSSPHAERSEHAWWLRCELS